VGSAFGDVTAVEPAGEGRYRGDIDASWNLRPLPQGGIVSALALRAVEAELADPAQRLRTLHTAFVAQVAHGPVDLDVEVLRRGRSMSHLRVEARNPGAARGHVTTAIHGGPREGFTFTDLRPPDDMPAPDDCPSFRDPPPEDVEPFEPMPFWAERVEGRPCLGDPPWDTEAPRLRAERAVWHRFDDPPFRDDGILDPLALVVLADVMPGAVGQKVGDTGRFWFAPSVDLTVHLLDDCRSPWVLCHNTARWAGDGYASADMALWDMSATPRLVAYATQLFLFSFL
jgi:acyl-CoA thioesterase